MEQEREAVTARLELAQQVVEQAREEMRSHVEQAQQFMEQGREEMMAHLERERTESRRQALPSNKGKLFEEVHIHVHMNLCKYTVCVEKSIEHVIPCTYMHFPRWVNDKSGEYWQSCEPVQPAFCNRLWGAMASHQQ